MVTAARYFEKFWNKSRIDTIEDMMRKLLEANVNFQGYTDKQFQDLLIDWLENYYGYNGDSAGLCGNCYEVFCTFDEENQDYAYLTTEQDKLLHFLIKKYFGDNIIEQMFFADEKREDVFTLIHYDKKKNGVFREFEEVTGQELRIGLALIRFSDEEDEEEDFEDGQILNEGVRCSL